MTLEIKLAPEARWVEPGEKLWLTADRSRLVPDGDEEAAFLFCLPGQRVSVGDAQRYGLVEAPAELAAEAVAEPVAEEAPAEPEPQPGLTTQPEAKRMRAPKGKKS